MTISATTMLLVVFLVVIAAVLLLLDRMHLAAKLRQAMRERDEAEATLQRTTKQYGRAAYFHDSVMAIVRDMGQEPQP